MKYKILSLKRLLLYVLLLVAVTLAIYLYISRSKQAALSESLVELIAYEAEDSFNTYSSDYGYKISYPKNWELYDPSPYHKSSSLTLISPQAVLASQIEGNYNKKQVSPLVEFECYNNWMDMVEGSVSISDSFKILNYDDIIKYLQQSQYYKYSEPTKFILDSMKMYGTGRYSDNNSSDSPDYLVFVSSDQLNCIVNFKNRKAYNDLSDEETKILSSIKQIPRVKKISPLTPREIKWEKYSNSDFNIEFEMPSDWKIEIKDGWLKLISSDIIKYEQICKMGIANCEGLSDGISIKKYNNMEDLKKYHNITDDSQDLLGYIHNQMRSDKSVVSVSKSYVGKYESYSTTLGGICDDYDTLFESYDLIYEIYSPCSDGPNEVEKKMLDSINIIK